MSKSSDVTTAPVLACDLNAIETEQRNPHLIRLKQVFGKIHTITELPNGYAFCLPSDTNTFLETARFVENERKCCPFNFAIELENGNDQFWLKVTGQEGTKLLIQHELGHHLNDPDTFSKLIAQASEAHLPQLNS